jgi:hypothetical protein
MEEMPKNRHPIPPRQDEPLMLKILSEFSEGMPLSWWRRVKISSTRLLGGLTL